MDLDRIPHRTGSRAKLTGRRGEETAAGQETILDHREPSVSELTQPRHSCRASWNAREDRRTDATRGKTEGLNLERLASTEQRLDRSLGHAGSRRDGAERQTLEALDGSEVHRSRED